MTSEMDPADELRRMRLAAGFTQEQLAGLAGIHLRTVRGLETRHVTTPRRSSLALLARAFGLDVTSTLRFMEAWGFAELAPVEVWDPLGEADPDRIDHYLAESAAHVTPVALSELTVVGVDRTVVSRRTEEVTVALSDCVVGRRIFYDPEEPHIDVEKFHLVELENCQVVRERIDHRGRGKLIELSYGRSLRRGESHIVRYTADMAAARRAPTIAAPDVGREIGGFIRSPASYVLEVRFHDRARPRWCTQVFQPTPQGRVRTVGPLRPDGSNTFHIALLNPKPGGHGILWGW